MSLWIKIAETPLRVYGALLAQRAGNADFAFGELEETIATRERHLWRIQWAVCGGQRYVGGQVHTESQARIKAQIQGQTFGKLRHDIDQPRRIPISDIDAIHLAVCNVRRYILLRARSEPELQRSVSHRR